jgi:hypothetical protein
MSRPDPETTGTPAKPGSSRSGAVKCVVVTGNALIDGAVVWLEEGGILSRDLTRAQVFTDPAQAQAALTLTATRHAEVVGCYLADVRQTPDGPQPTHFREGFRRDGPSTAARVPARLET